MKAKLFKFQIDPLKNNKRILILKAIDKKLSEIIKEDLPFFKLVKRFVIYSGGKRIRPLTHYYFCKLLNYEGSEWLDIASIGELIHAASLLHDDVIDDSNERRGKPTLHVKHGNKKTILGGDYLLACGIDHLQTLEHSKQLLPIFTRVIKNLSISEIIQMEYEKNPTLTIDIYEKIILGKTADLFSAMVEASAVLISLSNKEIQNYRNYGLKMGRLFQIRDDYLDYFSTKEELGKDLYQDYKRGLITYPVLILKQYLNRKEKKLIFHQWEDTEYRMKHLTDFLTLLEQYKIRKKIAIEIEENIQLLIHFINKHSTKHIPEKEEMIQTLKKLLVPVE